jgi:hypothetical protein
MSKQNPIARFGNESIIEARFISHPAQRWIEDRLPAKVLHVFPQSCNLINDDREVLSLVTEEIGPAPFAIVIDPLTAADWGERGLQNWIDSRSVVSIEADSVSVGGLFIQITDVDLWDPKLKIEDPTKTQASISRHLPSIIAILEASSISGSCTGILEYLLTSNVEHDDPQISAIGDRFLSAVIKPARALCQGFTSINLPLSIQAARGLAGLGTGLTPTGDDFLMGAFLGYHLFDPQGRSAEFSREIVNGLEGRTNALSMAFLRSAVRGEASIAWHELVSSIEHDSSDQLAKACQRILKTGHSSGADALTGFVTVLSWLLSE